MTIQKAMTNRHGSSGASCGRSRWAGRACAWGGVAAVVLLMAGAARAADWPQWRGPNRIGISAETNWLNNWPPVQVWTQYVGMGFSGTAISEGRLYTLGFNSATTQDTVYCFNVTNGVEIWRATYASAYMDNGYEGPRATPTVDGTNVYTYNQKGRFHAFNKYNGATNWTTTVADSMANRWWWGMSGSPLVDGNTLFFNAGGAGRAIDKIGTHSVIWSNAGKNHYTSPLKVTWNGQTSVVVIAENGLFGLNPLNGKTNYFYSWSTPWSSPDPTIYNDKIFITSSDDGQFGCRLLQLGTGVLSMVYATNILKSECSSPVLVGDYVYGFTGNTLACLDIRTGAGQWGQPDLFQDGDPKEGSLIAAGGRLIALGRAGRLRVMKASPAGFDPEGLAPVPVVPNAQSDEWWTAPSIADGVIYCRSRGGTLVALRVGGARADANTNGIPDIWEQSHFNSTTNSPPGADADKDQFPDRSEYVAGTDPTNAQSNLKLSLTRANGSLVVAWPTLAVRGIGYDESQSRFYKLETRGDLSKGFWEAVTGYTNVQGNGATAIYTNSPATRTGHYRVSARMQ